ncbi:MAG: prepilin-type N-terminal cleavage/methylation domain-containing protein [Nevskia sp.]|nr:prepilin-type N-terminal cleavage/methylation domain-containing protein [Nevskia sp.]
MNRKSAGFTLIELMVAVGIAAIVARIGFDIYIQYIMRANRAVGRTALVSLAAKEEVQALQNPGTGYATDFTTLIGLPASGGTSVTSYYIDQNGTASTSSTGGIYQISFSGTPSGSAYVLQAVAQGVQAKRDTACTTLTLSSTGLKQAQTSAGVAVSAANLPNCWEK